MLQHDLAVGVEEEADVEEPPGELRMPRLRLGHQERVPLPGQLAEVVRLRAGYVDRALPRDRLVVQVEPLVVEALQGPFGDGDQPDGQVEAGQPGRGLDQVRNVLQVDRDVGAAPDATHGGNKADGLVRLDHDASFLRLPLYVPDGPPPVCNLDVCESRTMINPQVA